MLQRGDVFDLMFRIRGGLARDMFGIQHQGLFTKAMAGTKLLIEKYHDTMTMALNYICDSSISEEEVCLLLLFCCVWIIERLLASSFTIRFRPTPSSHSSTKPATPTAARHFSFQAVRTLDTTIWV